MIPPALDHPELWTWLEANRDVRLRLPVRIEFDGLGVSATLAGSPISLDTGALGMTLQSHLHAFESPCLVWLDGSWGPLVPMPVDGPTFAVRSVGEAVVGEPHIQVP